MRVVEVDVLIVGAGPAGASLACFLAYHGITGLMISKEKHTALQPRAHMMNMATWECLRDIGLEQEYRQISMGKEYYGDYRYCTSLNGADIVRMRSFGCEPQRLGDYNDASPCDHGDVSQHTGEPVLHRYATTHGFQSRFQTHFMQYSEDESTGLITTTVSDELTGEEFKVVSKYLCGADGGASKVAAQAGLVYNTLRRLGAAINVWYEADLSHIYKANPGVLTVITNPHVDSPPWAVWALNRVVRPHSEFIMGMMAAPGVDSVSVTEDEVMKRLYELIGDDNVRIKIKGIYRWRVNESYAESISVNNRVFCLGDAIHQHSPGKGLGANTSMQDAYNLAWKLAYVLKGNASASLLDSYNAERQPVGQYVVRTANDTVRYMRALTEAMGATEPTVEGRMAVLKELKEASSKGAQRRAALKAARELMFDENSALGAEMNQAYKSSAVYLDDEADPNMGLPSGSEGVRHHIISTYPGSRLPHAWLGTKRSGERVSTHDVAGKGRFSLFTGIGGAEPWARAIKTAAKEIIGGVEVVLITVGFGQEYDDMYCTWDKHRGVSDDGAVLVRPDRTVAWRCQDASTADPEEKLLAVMKRILGRE